MEFDDRKLDTQTIILLATLLKNSSAKSTLDYYARSADIAENLDLADSLKRSNAEKTEEDPEAPF